MAMFFKCDRCGTVEEASTIPDKHRPDNWDVIAGYDLCVKCHTAFMDFMHDILKLPAEKH